VFGETTQSPYILPYNVGESYSLLQTYCGPLSHARDNQLAYDFLLPIGAEIIAVRAGTVRIVVDTYADDDLIGSHNNHIFIEHADGSTAMYAHLVQHSAVVQPGDIVAQGQLIGLSGTSGTSIAHLHLGVYRTWPHRGGDDLPINFRNADGALDERNGLQLGVSYTALPW
jgi:murein DD-endopeptidase MepM/ murein hydrolase activator NlpD